ncbi:MAG: hypothetical protein DRP64_16180 [Verrucomicrobia bacterium]|nr:MAG: hypothetical protein DRP64_16180 [Verrucomicrobiota bacterium]
MSVAESVRNEFDGLPPGGVIASAELHRLSEDSTQVDKATSRLFKKAGLRKIRNGIYYRPVNSQHFGTLPPKNKDILKSVKTQYKATLIPSGELATYELGLIAHAPSKKIYNTNKRIAPIATDNCQISFRQVLGKKLHSAGSGLVTLLTALEYLLKREEKLNALQRASVERQLGLYPQQVINKALTQWPLWFRQDIAPLLKASSTEHYITGISAFNIPFQGQLADWHQMGMLAKGKFQITGKNYHSAPGLKPDELFDCSNFLEKHAMGVNVTLCARPARAIKDILYTNIFIKNRYPDVLDLDQFLLTLSSQELKTCVNQLLPLANEQQVKQLNQWLTDNDIH